MSQPATERVLQTTGLAPFIGIIQDPETCERFETVVLIHGARQVSELAQAEFVES